MITHDMGVVAETADRVVVQYKGEDGRGRRAVAVRNPQNPYTRALLVGPAGKRHRRPAAHRSDFFRRRRRPRDDRCSSKARPSSATTTSPAACSPGPRTVRALKGVDFKVEKGKTLAIVGESGCGKSTLARIITLIDAPTSGELLIEGKPVDIARAADAGDALARCRSCSRTPMAR
jgi:ABC-type glutathione transport system ATPase component